MDIEDIYKQVEKNIDNLVDNDVGFSIPVTHDEIEEFKATHKISADFMKNNGVGIVCAILRLQQEQLNNKMYPLQHGQFLKAVCIPSREQAAQLRA